MYTIQLSDRDSLISTRFEPLVMSVMVANAAGLALPPQSFVKWMEKVVVGDWDQGPWFWQPYEVLDNGVVVVKRWARGGYSYLTSTIASAAPPIEGLDPTVWHYRLPELLNRFPDSKDNGLGGGLKVVVEVAIDQTIPKGDDIHSERLERLHEQVRVAAATGKVLTKKAAVQRQMQAAIRRQMQAGGYGRLASDFASDY